MKIALIRLSWILPLLFSSWLWVYLSVGQDSPQPPEDRYLVWARGQFGVAVVANPALKATVWGPEANPEGDAFVNLLEYTLGFDADAHSPVPPDWFEIKEGPDGKQHVHLNVTHRHDDPDLLVLPQVSGDLDDSNWSPAPPADLENWLGEIAPVALAEAAPVGLDFTRSSWFDPADADLAVSRFMRIYVRRFGAVAATANVEPTSFTDQNAVPSGATIQSNPVVLRGFAGLIGISVDNGARILINGENRGNSTTARPGDVLTIEADTPATDGATRAINVTIGDRQSVWRFTTAEIAPVPNQNGTASGYTPVEVNVNEGGAAQISIPIVCSPGTGGMQPELAISYSSQGGNGLLGVGFQLSGLSQITRTPATIAQDGRKGRIGLDDDDRFALDGQRLIAINGVDGGDNTEYRTEIDSFSRIVSHRTLAPYPARFLAQTKSGLEYRYGYVSNARMFGEGSTTALAWMLNRVTDTAGNYFEITYDNAGRLRGEWMPTQIVYTSNNGEGLAGNQTIDFIYEDRPDVSLAYVAGFASHRTKRLKRIECRQGGALVRRYDFAYHNTGPSNFSRLRSVVETGSDGSSFPPTVFNWRADDAPDLILEEEIGFSDNPAFDRSPPAQMVNGDFNGDGLIDLVKLNDHGNAWIALSNGDGTFSYSTNVPGLNGRQMSSGSQNSRVRTGDFNADGNTDILHLYFQGSASFLAYSNGDGTFTTLENDSLGGLKDFTFPAGSSSETLAMDFNGDGRTDIALVQNSGDNFVALADTDPNVVFVAVEDTGELETRRISDSTSRRYSWVFPGDYNGDGLGDILHMYYTGQEHWLALSNGDGTFTVKDGADLGELDQKNFAISYSYFSSGDYNGDGLSDVFNQTEHRGGNFLLLSRGDGSFELTEGVPGLENAICSNSGPSYSDLHSLDVNGDGLSDIYHSYYRPSLAWLAISKGDGSFEFLENGELSALDEKSFSAGFVDSRIFPADYTGDGVSDVLHLRYGGDHWMARSDVPQPNRIGSVVNGHGRVTQITYRALTDPGIYTKGNTAQYPCHDFVAPIHVVSEISTDNGIGGTTTINYAYEEAWMCLDGRGFRGFKCVEVTNQTTGIVTRTEYDERPLAAGRPVHSEQLLADGTMISESDNTWTIVEHNHPTGNKTYEVRNTQSVAREYEINTGALVKTTTTSYDAFDEFGNVLDMTVGYGGGFTERTVSQYSNPTGGGRWHLGRLTQSQVTKTAPGTPNLIRTSAFEYHTNTGLLTKEIIEPNGGVLRLEKTYLHDGFGNIVQSTLSAAGEPDRVTLSRYSPDGRFEVETENALGHVETKTFDSLLGNVLTQTGPNEITTTWEYDGFGRPTREARSDGTETRTFYLRANPGQGGAPNHAVHQVVTHTSGELPKHMFYDLLDRELRSRRYAFDATTGVFSDTVYNARGEVISRSDPYFEGDPPQVTTTTYDAIGRPRFQTAPGNRVSETRYNGLVTTFINPKNQTTIREVNVKGKPVKVTDAHNKVIDYTYDAYDNVTQIHDAEGNATAIVYDVRGNKISITEPNTGTTTFVYNAFGELVRQTDAKGQTVILEYDPLGRLIRRTEPEGVSSWEYDTAPKGFGKIAAEAGPNGFSKRYYYDGLGRPAGMAIVIEGRVYTTGTNYDQYSRAASTTYPTGYSTHNYYQVGYLLRVTNAAGLNLWKANRVNARGQIEDEVLSGGATNTLRTYDPVTGLLQRIQTDSGEGAIQDLSYQFDALNNLTARGDALNQIDEGFTYDNLNRLTNFSATGLPNIGVTYDALGNITSRSDTGQYQYGAGPAGPHALTGITNRPDGGDLSYTYDANGNQTAGAGRTLEYTSFNKPSRIAQGAAVLQFACAPDRSRFRQTIVNGADTLTRHYVGGLYEYEDRGATRRHIHYVRAAAGVFLTHTVVVENGQSEKEDRYLHKDHLGSVETITFPNGRVAETLKYDAWGRRLQVIAQAAGGGAVLSYGAVTRIVEDVHRGFTGHEMLDLVGLVHMGGRVYDNVVGRFLSADPFVQAPENLQNLNRYSYVLNNPLSYTDPSGFFWKKLKKFFKKHWRTAVTIAAGVLTGGAALAATGLSLTSFAGAVVAGAAGSFGSAFSGTLLAGGSIGDALRAGVRGAIQGAVTAVALYGINVIAPDWLASNTLPEVKVASWSHAEATVQAINDTFESGRIGTQIFRIGARAAVRGGVAEAFGGNFGQAVRWSAVPDVAKWGMDLVTEFGFREEAARLGNHVIRAKTENTPYGQEVVFRGRTHYSLQELRKRGFGFVWGKRQPSYYREHPSMAMWSQSINQAGAQNSTNFFTGEGGFVMPTIVQAGLLGNAHASTHDQFVTSFWIGGRAIGDIPGLNELSNVPWVVPNYAAHLSNISAPHLARP